MLDIVFSSVCSHVDACELFGISVGIKVTKFNYVVFDTYCLAVYGLGGPLPSLTCATDFSAVARWSTVTV
jgi:hypothetical protein